MAILRLWRTEFGQREHIRENKIANLPNQHNQEMENIPGPWWTNCSSCSVGAAHWVQQTRGGHGWRGHDGHCKEQIGSDLNEEVFVSENEKPAGVWIVNFKTVLYARANLKIWQNCEVSTNKMSL